MRDSRVFLCYSAALFQRTGLQTYLNSPCEQLAVRFFFKQKSHQETRMQLLNHNLIYLTNLTLPRKSTRIDSFYAIPFKFFFFKEIYLIK